METVKAIDGRTTVRKGMRGHLMNSSPGVPWNVILSALLNEHGSIAAAAKAINTDVQTVRKWKKAEVDSGRMVEIDQPPRVYKAVTQHEA